MTDEQIALARRAAACRGWRWMPGMVMLWLSGEVGGFSSWARPMTVSSDGSINWWEGDPPTDEVDEVWQDKAIPDLTDAATLGCLLALVREAWGDHANSFANGYEEPQKMWEVYNGRINSDDYGHEIATGSTEVEALVAALEAAP